MKKIYVLVVVVMFFVACKKPGPSTIARPAVAIPGTACFYGRSEKTSENTFPFSESDKVELVSYETRKLGYGNDTLIRDGKFVVPDIQQRQALDQTQRDSLFSILHNIHNDADSSYAEADCYFPHHAVVFYEKETAIAFYEICFSCHGVRTTPGIDFGDLCDGKICMLQRFFYANKVDFAMNMEQFEFECGALSEK